MAINPNPKHRNRHACFVAMSGFGKSQGLKNELPKSGVRHILWDPDDDHKAHHYDDKKAFSAALLSACKASARGRGFRVAWNGAVDVETFEWWCQCVWAVLNGNVDTHITIEELADVSPAAGKATPHFGQLIRRARKYGGIVRFTTQRSQEISKTAYDQCAIKYIGYPNDGANIKDLANLAQVSEDELKKLAPLQFFRREHIKTDLVRFKVIRN